MAFVFHSDPSHGWLEVSLSDLAAVGLGPSDFSRYSYVGDNRLFLEEDCDAPKFLLAWEVQSGLGTIEITELYHRGEAFVRALPRLSRGN